MNRFDNGFDSFKKAIKGIENRDQDEFALKEIITNFHHCIEVLFKHLLYCKEKFLIYDTEKWMNSQFDKKIGKSVKQSSKDEYTITFDATVKRVIVLFNIRINSYIHNGFIRLNKLRNSLAHDEIELKMAEVEEIFVCLITTVTHILQSYLPDKEKQVFCEYIDSDDYSRIIKNLFLCNANWRVITISNLLGLYMDEQYENLNPSQIANISKTLLQLGVLTSEEDGFFYIDGNYYVSCISYLKQELCRKLVLAYNEENSRRNELAELLKENTAIPKVLSEHLIAAKSYLLNLLGGKNKDFFENSHEIDSFFKSNTFVNNHDIYVILNCINQIWQAYEMFACENKSHVLSKNLYMDEEQTLHPKKIYSALMKWFTSNGWYNDSNTEKLNEHEETVFCKSGYKIHDDVYDGIYKYELFQKIIGTMGDWSSIDAIEYADVEDLVTIVRTDSGYIAVFTVSFETQTYYDHEYYSNGSVDCFIALYGTIVDNDFVISDMENMGTTVGFHSFRFM